MYTPLERGWAVAILVDDEVGGKPSKGGVDTKMTGPSGGGKRKSTPPLYGLSVSDRIEGRKYKVEDLIIGTRMPVLFFGRNVFLC